MALASTFVAGCSGFGPTVNLGINEPTQNVVQAVGYPSKDNVEGNSRYYSLSIRLQAVQPFTFIFPDGYRADSRQITEFVLERHLAPVRWSAYGTREAALELRDANGRFTVSFFTGPDGYATSLRLYSCRHKALPVLATADGRETFDFPIRQAEIGKLFSGRLQTGRDLQLLGDKCI